MYSRTRSWRSVRPAQPKRDTSQMTVDELNAYIQGMFSSDLMLKSLFVDGEIAEFKRHTSGHCYFTLIGEETRISCALFKNDAANLPQWPQNGDSVTVEGSVGVYPARGAYQLYAKNIVPVGAGAMDRARQEVRRRLEAEGLFHPSIKRPIPHMPSRAAVVTSGTGAALRDVLRISSRRWPLCGIVVVPALVQGAEAPADIVRAMGLASSLTDIDCVLLVRGGGSREDLVPFDDERVVRAVRACPYPVISGVGHEIDETLCDLAADLRASTPSAAAEMVFPDGDALLGQLRYALSRLNGCAVRRIDDDRSRLRDALDDMRSAAERRIDAERTELRSAFDALSSAMTLKMADAKNAMAVRTASLNAMSPLAVLSRGFVTAEIDGRRLTSIDDIHKDDGLSVRFADGAAECVVAAVRKNDE